MDRLTWQDVSFLYVEQPGAAMHVGTVMVFDVPDGGLDLERLTRHIESRLAHVPRYRRRLRHVPGGMSTPVWVDDARFDLSYHVRRSALPRPGDDRQLAELVARLQARPLDRRRPLWEVYVVEGLVGDRFALVSKVHQAIVDGVHNVDLGHVILDDTADVGAPPALQWHPQPEPTDAELLVAAVADMVRSPARLVEAVRGGLADADRTARTLLGGAGRVAGIARRLAFGGPPSPVSGPVTPHRRFATADTRLQDYRTVRHRLAAPPRRRERMVRPANVSVNDVVLAVLAGALRMWLLGRGQAVPPGHVVRTLVPVSVVPGGPRVPGGAGSQPSADVVGGPLTSLLVDLPTGEPNPAMRLHQVAYQTKAHRDAGYGVSAASMVGLAGFAAPTLHSLGARLAGGLNRRMFHLVVTNVPGPQEPRYAAGARLLASYPVMPVGAGQSLSIGVTSYDGHVQFGINASRDAVPDVEALADAIADALVELLEALR